MVFCDFARINTEISSYDGLSYISRSSDISATSADVSGSTISPIRDNSSKGGNLIS